MMKIVAVGNFRGGIGKTTTTVNLAHCLSDMGQKTLVIDADPQNNTTPFFAKAVEDGKTLAEVIKNPSNVKEYITPTRYKNLDIIKGSTTLMGEEFGDRKLGWLAAVRETVGEEYDVCIVDTNPDLSSLTASVMAASDVLLTPVRLNTSCRDNLALLQEKIDDLVENGLTWKIIATMVDLRRKSQKKGLEDIVNKHLYPFMENYISSSADIDNAWDLYKPVGLHRSKSMVAEEFRTLASELMDVLEEV